MGSYKTHSSSYSFNASSSSTSSSPSPLPRPPISQSLSKSYVPFLWEEKPGVTKPNLSNPSSLQVSTSPKNLFYGKSLEYPPLPPPPSRLSQALPSQPRSRESKLLAAHSLLRRRPHEASFKRPTKREEEGQDPFFLALKACTKGGNKYSRGGLKQDKVASFDGLQAALRDLFKPSNKGQKSMGGKEGIKGASKKYDEESDDHQWMREKSLKGEADNGRSWHVKPKHTTKVYEFSNINQGPGKPKHTTKVYEFSNVNQGQGKPKHNNAKVDEIKQGHYKPKHNAKVVQFASINNQGHHKPKQNAKVVEFNYCGGLIRDNDYGLHFSCKQSIFTDLLGCKSLNGAVIHPSFMLQNKPFS